MTELCHVLTAYSFIPMLHVDIVTEEVTAIIRYVIGKGYTLASEYGVIVADSYNGMIHQFKQAHCPDEILEPMIEWALR